MSHLNTCSRHECHCTCESNLYSSVIGCACLIWPCVGAGVLVNPLVPDWLLIILLTVVLLLLATRLVRKAGQMHAAETAVLTSDSPTSDELRLAPALSLAKSMSQPPFQAAAKVPNSLALPAR